ncbi:ADP compounds hydrolase NudE [Pseudaeromonas sharmana]|uniref:ADP compounds hydrolase NudE n=1 Tax=Pseudaeromonas sharmana TaxID=328412 RepID=A0ABV8CKS5_9GAMM
MSREKRKPEILRRELVAQSRLFRIESLHLRFANGVERQYERMQGGHQGAVMLVPIQDDGTLLLVREYAAGTHAYELGFPKGVIDPGENADQAGNRELMEETGFGAGTLIPLKELTLAPGFLGSRMSVLLARDLYPEQRDGDEPEPLERVSWPLAQAQALLAEPEFSDARSVAALLLALEWLKMQR